MATLFPTETHTPGGLISNPLASSLIHLPNWLAAQKQEKILCVPFSLQPAFG